MDMNKLYDNVVKARDENIPKGIEFAWCDVYGNNVSWNDLVYATSLLVDIGGVKELDKPHVDPEAPEAPEAVEAPKDE